MKLLLVICVLAVGSAAYDIDCDNINPDAKKVGSNQSKSSHEPCSFAKLLWHIYIHGELPTYEFVRSLSMMESRAGLCLW